MPRWFSLIELNSGISFPLCYTNLTTKVEFRKYSDEFFSESNIFEAMGFMMNNEPL